MNATPPESYVAALARELDILREYYRATASAVAAYDDGKLTTGALVNQLIGALSTVRQHDCRLEKLLHGHARGS